MFLSGSQVIDRGGELTSKKSKIFTSHQFDLGGGCTNTNLDFFDLP